ncbi:MAG: hypothetical protein KatS3mg058_0675 [Roseiflexus sp.]|nr:MAG: hypothetical protein KatS3mg058_0675 [Roseiflexus sp.]
MTLEDAACVSFRALRFAQGKRSAESERVAHDPSLCSGRPCRMFTGNWYGRREARGERREAIPMTLEDAACVSFRALRFAQGKRSAESERVAHDPSLCSG